MAIKSARVTIGTAPTPLNSADVSGISGSGIAVKNLAAVEIFIGGADVTTANGFPVPAGGSFEIDFESANEIAYAVVSLGTAEVVVLAAGA